MSLWLAADSLPSWEMFHVISSFRPPGAKHCCISGPTGPRTLTHRGSDLSWIQCFTLVHFTPVHIPCNPFPRLTCSLYQHSILLPASLRRQEPFSSLFSTVFLPDTASISCPLFQREKESPNASFPTIPDSSRTSLLFFQSLCPLISLSSLLFTDSFKFLSSLSFLYYQTSMSYSPFSWYITFCSLIATLTILC